MSSKRRAALVPLLAAGGLVAGCASIPTPAAAVSNAITCGSVVDPTGYQGGPLTPGRAVQSLTAMLRDGGSARIPRGTPSSADTSTLDLMAVELIGYWGNKLSSDAEDFAEAEFNYNPDGPVEAGYARGLDRDIGALQRDCPPGPP